MQTKNTRLPAAFAALALLLSLLAGCAAQPEQVHPADKPSPEQTQQTAPTPDAAPSAEPSAPAPTDTPEAAPEPTQAPEPSPTPKPTPEPTPEPTPTPAPTQSVPEDGNYTAGVTLAGGSGRASVQSPATLRCTDGQFYATIVWSSPNFDYMKINSARYDPISSPGENSAFEIPVAAFDQALDVIADTVAMSEPHEVEYTLTFDSSTLTKQ